MAEELGLLCVNFYGYTLNQIYTFRDGGRGGGVVGGGCHIRRWHPYWSCLNLIYPGFWDNSQGVTFVDPTFRNTFSANKCNRLGNIPKTKINHSDHIGILKSRLFKHILFSYFILRCKVHGQYRVTKKDRAVMQIICDHSYVNSVNTTTVSMCSEAHSADVLENAAGTPQTHSAIDPVPYSREENPRYTLNTSHCDAGC